MIRRRKISAIWVTHNSKPISMTRRGEWGRPKDVRFTERCYLALTARLHTLRTGRIPCTGEHFTVTERQSFADCVRDLYTLYDVNRNTHSRAIYGLERNTHTITVTKRTRTHAHTTGTMATAICVGAGSGLSIITIFFSCGKIGSVEFGGTVGAREKTEQARLWWMSHLQVQHCYR